jgi:hypothetical protein
MKRGRKLSAVVAVGEAAAMAGDAVAEAGDAVAEAGDAAEIAATAATAGNPSKLWVAAPALSRRRFASS